MDKLDLFKIVKSYMRKNMEEIVMRHKERNQDDPVVEPADRELALEMGRYLVNHGYNPFPWLVVDAYRGAKIIAEAEVEKAKQNKYSGKRKAPKGGKKKGGKGGDNGSQVSRSARSLLCTQPCGVSHYLTVSHRIVPLSHTPQHSNSQSKKTSSKKKQKLKIDLTIPHFMKNAMNSDRLAVYGYSTLPGAVIFNVGGQANGSGWFGQQHEGDFYVTVRTGSAEEFKEPEVLLLTGNKFGAQFPNYNSLKIASPHHCRGLIVYHNGLGEFCTYVVDPVERGFRRINDLVGMVSYDNYLFGCSYDVDSLTLYAVRYNLEDDLYLPRAITIATDYRATTGFDDYVYPCGDQILIYCQSAGLTYIVDTELNVLHTLVTGEDMNWRAHPNVIATYAREGAVHHAISHGRGLTVWSPDSGEWVGG